MKLSAINTRQKDPNNKYNNANITNVRNTVINRDDNRRVFITNERVPGPGPGVPATQEAIAHPGNVLSPIRSYITRDEDIANNLLFDKYIFDKKTVSGGRNITKREQSIIEQQPLKNQIMLEKVGRIEDYRNAFQGLANLNGNRVQGKQLERAIRNSNASYRKI